MRIRAGEAVDWLWLSTIVEVELVASVQGDECSGCGIGGVGKG